MSTSKPLVIRKKVEMRLGLECSNVLGWYSLLFLKALMVAWLLQKLKN